MKKAEFLKILKKYRSGKASEQEKSFLAAYYNLFEAEYDVTEMLDNEEKDFLKNQIKAGIKQQIALHQQKPAAKTYNMLRRIAVAAVVLAVCSVGIYDYVNNTNPFTGKKYSKNDVAPGGNKAILTLANGRQIILNNTNNGILAKLGGIQITKTANGQVVYHILNTANLSDTSYNTISTPRGGEFTVILADSSKVYLNAASSLKFPVAFTGTIRRVILTGEAYFEIAHNKLKPFRVLAKGQQVEVLGTHFNINAYDDEKYIKTTLLEGSVKVSASGQTAILKPGEQSQVLSGENTAAVNVVTNANIDEAVAWKNGLFYFENADIQTILKQYARWYNVNVVYEGKPGKRLFSGEIHRNLNASQALDLLNYADVDFSIDGKTITVSP